MKLSKEANLVIEHCYKDGKPVATRAIIGEKYIVNGHTFIFSQDLIDEIISSQAIKVSMGGKNVVNLMGI